MKTIFGVVILGLSILTVPFTGTRARADCPPDVGAALSAACPCSGPAHGGAWKNHGQHQSCVVHFRNDLRIVRIPQNCDPRECWDHLFEELQPLHAVVSRKHGEPCNIAAWMGKALKRP